jgi:tripartite-type tricarboxylate transporter receptor subunit TctC
MTESQTRRLCGSILVGLSLVAPAIAQQSYPDRVVRIIVPLPPGGFADLLTRQVASQLSPRWNQPVITENRPGANTIPAAAFVSKQPADGYTILLATDATMSINPHLYARLQYDPARDFVPVTQLVVVPLALVAHSSVPASNVSELIAVVKAKPGAFSYASYGAGSTPHLAMETLKSQAGLDVIHVPYKATADAIPATAGGVVQLTYSGVVSALPFIKSDRLKALAIGGPRRSALVPNVPTFAEQGFPEVNSTAWFGLVVPAGTPRDTVSKIHRDVVRIASDAAFRDQYVSGNGADVIASSPDEFAAFLLRDRAGAARATKVAGLTAE